MLDPKVSRGYRNAVLLIASLVFYAFGGVRYLALIGAVVLINYLGAFLCAPNDKNSGRKAVFTGVVVANFLILFVFKYLSFSVHIIENIVKGRAEFPEILLPIGISFYIFQAVSYVIDVYRGVVPVQKNFFRFFLYISFFPQLIAGPIVQYKDIETQLSGRSEDAENFAEGIRRFCFGLAKKVLIANALAETVDEVWALNVGELGAAITWFTAIAYSFQIYYDFSGYSDMAIGLGKMFGFTFKENFNYPYLADSVRNFWRRWHISLSTWFRDYLYIPLGGSRCGKAKLYRNILVVFLLTGIWHGANTTFPVWGLIYGILLVIERIFEGKQFKFRLPLFVKRVFTFVIVTLLWVIFRADSLRDAFAFIGSMFKGNSSENALLSFLSGRTVFAFLAAILCSGLLSNIRIKNEKAMNLIKSLFCLVLLAISLIALTNETYNPFIYFRF